VIDLVLERLVVERRFLAGGDRPQGPHLHLLDARLEAKVLIERWRQHSKTIRPHSALGYRSPAPQAWQPFDFVRSLVFHKRTPRQWISSGRATLLFSSFTSSCRRFWKNFRIERIAR
jgi:transposase InsO family protein